MADVASLADRLDASVWTGVGAIGILLFVLGIYQPALSGVPYSSYLEIPIAVAGACLAVLGFSFAAEQRRAQRPGPRRLRPVHAEITEEFGPSFEVYDPRTAEEGPVPEPRPPGPA